MKRFLILALFALTVIPAWAQFVDYKGWQSHEIEIMGGFGKCGGTESFSYVHEEKTVPAVTVAYTFKFNKYFGLGAGLMYDRFKVSPLIDGGKSEVSNCNAFSLYGTIRGYLPTYSKYIAFVGVVDIGGTSTQLFGDVRMPSGSFVWSPQLGIRVKLFKDKKMALNARVFYKDFTKLETDLWGVLLGVNF